MLILEGAMKKVAVISASSKICNQEKGSNPFLLFSGIFDARWFSGGSYRIDLSAYGKEAAFGYGCKCK